MDGEGGGGATTDSARRADEALDRLIDKVRDGSDVDGRDLADFFVRRASALAEEFNAKQRRDVRGFRDEIVSAWLSGQKDVAVVGAAVFVRGVLEPLGSYPRAVPAALSADLALAGAVPRWAGKEIVRAVAALLEVPLTEVEQHVLGSQSETAETARTPAPPTPSRDESVGRLLASGVLLFVKCLLLLGVSTGGIVALMYVVAEARDRAGAPARAVQAGFDEQYPDGRVASQIEHVQDGGLAFTAIIDGVVHRCVATASGDALECAPGTAE